MTEKDPRSIKFQEIPGYIITKEKLSHSPLKIAFQTAKFYIIKIAIFQGEQ